MSKNNNTILCKILLSEGKVVKKTVLQETLILTVEAFGHTYKIEKPYSKYCKISQEN
jgi:hypothetical protein